MHEKSQDGRRKEFILSIELSEIFSKGGRGLFLKLIVTKNNEFLVRNISVHQLTPCPLTSQNRAEHYIDKL